LLELLTTFVEKAQFKSALQAALKDMMYVSIAYLQMTQVNIRNTSWHHAAVYSVQQGGLEHATSGVEPLEIQVFHP
jgi:hypothetical protein